PQHTARCDLFLLLLVELRQGTDRWDARAQHPSREDRRLSARPRRRVPPLHRVLHLLYRALHRCDLGGIRRAEAGLARQDRRHLRREGLTAPTELLARGRDADVYAIDERTVLRRYRTRTVPEAERAVMRHARAAGLSRPRSF